MGGSSKKVTVGYKYYVGMHMALCHGPVDKLVRIRVGGKQVWSGNNYGGQLYIDKPDVFGGEKREGGVSGYVDLEMGKPDQGQNSYLAAKLGSSLLPAFRGVCCAVLRQVYIGLNPYLKDWGWLLQRIHTTGNGETQWYDEVAAIGVSSGSEGVSPTSAFEYRIIDGVVDTTTEAARAAIEIPSGGWSGPAKAPFGYEAELNTGWEPPIPINTIWIPGYYSLLNVWTPTSLWLRKEIVVTSVAQDMSVSGSVENAALFYLNGEYVGGVNITNAQVTRDLGFSFSIPKEKLRIGVNELHVLVLNEVNASGEYEPGDNTYFYAITSAREWDYDYADMNPAHIIRECLTDTNWGMGYPVSDIDDPSFRAAAATLFTEGMGISILWSQQTSIDDFVEEILRHIDAALYVDRSTGKFILKLIRGDYNESSLLVLDKTNISRVEGYTKQTLAELINEVTVSYISNETGQETVTLQNLAMIQQQGAVISSNVDYPGFTNQSVAARVAARDLKAVSTPLVSATLYATRVAADLNIGDVFVWNWEEENEDGAGLATSYVMRVSEIAFGDGVDNVVRIQCVQDVFALPDIVYVEAEPTAWADPSASPLPASPRLVTEMPYYEIVRQIGELDATAKLTSLPGLGFLMIAASRQAAEINAEIQVDSGGGYADGGMLDFCPCAYLEGFIGRADTSAALEGGVDIDEVVAGSLAQIDNEIIVVESITDGVATIRRGCLDTVPAPHDDGAAVFIWDNYATGDGAEYVASDTVDVKILTISDQGPLSLLDAPVDSVTMDQRAVRPYPPGKFQIDGQYYPQNYLLPATGSTITWAHRDRTQQTSGIVADHTAASIGPEAGIAYRVQIDALDAAEALIQAAIVSESVGTATSYSLIPSGITVPEGTTKIRVSVTTVRDGVDSWQSPGVVIGLLRAPTGLTLTYLEMSGPVNFRASVVG